MQMHPPGVAYCPSCRITREYLSSEAGKCSKYGTWLSHVISCLKHGPNLFQDYCCLCLSKVDCKKTFGSVAPYDIFPFESEACSQCTSRSNAT